LMDFCMFVLLSICPPSELFLCSFVTLSGGGQRLHHTAGGQQSQHTWWLCCLLKVLKAAAPGESLLLR